MVEDWGLYRIFLEVVRAGSFRKAQDSLKLTQPTIGAKLDRLEQMVGKKLLFRTATGISVTDEGQHFIKIAERMEAVASESNFVAEHPKLKINCTDGFGGYWILYILNEFNERHPNTRLDLRCFEDFSRSNIAGDTDLFISYDPPTDQDAVILTETSVTARPFCVRSYAEKYGIPTSMDDLLNFPVCAQDLHYDRSNPTLAPWADMLERHPKVLYSTNSSLSTVNATKAGLVISLQPVGAGDTEPNAIMLDFFSCTLSLYMYTHKSKKDYNPIRNIIDIFKETVFQNKSFGLAKHF